MELQTERRGNHEIERAFLRFEVVRGQFARGNDGVVRGDFSRIPRGAFERGVSLSRDLFQTGKRGKRGQYSGGFLILLDRQIAAICSGIGGQFALIQGLRGIQHFLSRHAELGGSGFLQGGKTVRQGRGLAFVLPQGFRNNALHAVDPFKNGGNLGAMGCVGFLFSQKGVIDISLEDKDADEAMMDALDAGAEDFDASEDAAEVTTDPENYSAVVKALEEKGYEILSDDLAMVPMTTTRLTDPDQLKAMGKLLDALEDNDDVQNVWHNWEQE